MSTPTHPSVADLRAFSQGTISGRELTNITAHLDACAECCARLDELFAKDALLARLQNPARANRRILVEKSQRRRAVRALHRGNLSGTTAAASTAFRASTAGGKLPLDSDKTWFRACAVDNEAAEPDLPRRMGEYEILTELGRGG